MYSCQKCGGAVGEPGKAYGYAGKWCCCNSPMPSSPLLGELSKPLGPIVRVPLDSQPFLQWLRGYLDAGGNDTGRIASELNKVLS